MRLSFASAVFFLTVAAPVLTAPVPSPLSDTTQAILAKRTPGEKLNKALHVAEEVGGVAFPEVKGAELALHVAHAVEEHQHHRN
ncbi:hypothetical protein FRC15_001989 [Serendipita sp. 397]|nr:hypothetical protein FRC15_001989 [Serendipita sp. 397]KAG8816451.1 hypothetical protein FRC18_000996 [Serendipita sp. 400]